MTTLLIGWTKVLRCLVRTKHIHGVSNQNEVSRKATVCTLYIYLYDMYSVVWPIHVLLNISPLTL